MLHKRRIDRIRKDHSVDSGFLEHVDILALLFLVRYIEDLVLVFLLVLLKAVSECQIFAVQVLIKDVIFHLLIELLVL